MRLRRAAATAVASVIVATTATVMVCGARLANDARQSPSSASVRTNANFSANGSSPIPINVWTHLAATYDGTSLRLFVNGVEVDNTLLGSAITTSAGALRIGGNAINGQYFRGLIDDVRIYNRALSATEIQADMNTPVQ
jgi:ABC-type phosphate transport system substrate-binding protein